MNVIMYALLIAVVVFNGCKELRDMRCPTPWAAEAVCHGWNGAPFKDGIAHETDTAAEMCQKTVEESRFTRKMVLWRRSLVIATIAAVMVVLLALGWIPVWWRFYLVVFVIMMTVYHVTAYYHHHVNHSATEVTAHNMRLLQRKYTMAERPGWEVHHATVREARDAVGGNSAVPYGRWETYR